MSIRNTYQKEMIINNLRSRCDHPTIKQIYDDLKDEGIGQATIYRNLKKMVENGEAVEIIDNNHISHFDALKNKHCHFLCSKCGEITDIAINELFRDDLEYVIDFSNVTLNGICQKCLKKGK